MTGARPLLVALALALAACGRTEPRTRAPDGPGGSLENAAPPAPPAPGNGYLKLRTVYDYVGDRAGTRWEPFELNGDYNYPEPIYGGWPVRITPVDASGSSTGPTEEITTLQELSPTDGRYVERPAGRYRLEKVLPSLTQGGGVWSVTGANSSQGETTTAAGAVASQFVIVEAGETTVARFFSVCRLSGAVQRFPEGARENVNTFDWVCRASFASQAGQLDPSFGTEGRAGTNFGGLLTQAFDAALAPGDKIVVVGKGAADWAVARFNADGSPDSSFGSSGVTSFQVPDAFSVTAVAAQADGKVVVAGNSRQGTSGPSSYFLRRFNADGTPDSDFGTPGGNVGSGRGTDVFDMEVQPDGKTVVVGRAYGEISDSTFGYFFFTARYNPDGSLDPSFGGDGVVLTRGFATSAADSDGEATEVAVGLDGKIVVGGETTPLPGPSSQVAAIRYNPDGSLAQGLGAAATSVERRFNRAAGVAVQADSKVVVAGAGRPFASKPDDLFVLRYGTDGRLDSSFGGDGIVNRAFGFDLPDGPDSVANDVVLQADGKIVVVGENNNLPLVARFNPDGSLDSSFGVGGSVTTGGGFAVLLQSDGKIVTVGSADGVFLIRYLP